MYWTPARRCATVGVVGPAAELDPAGLAQLEERMTHEPPECAAAGAYHAALFGAPTLAHYRAVYAQAGAPWPGEAFVRRHFLMADAS